MPGSSAIVRRLVDVREAVTTVPSREAWLRCAAIYLGFLACALPVGIASGLLHLSIAPLSPLAVAIVFGTILVHPAITEEIVFRALLLPRRPETISRARLALTVFSALLIYVVAHPLNAWAFWPASLVVFANPWYLSLAALLGIACTTAYFASGSIWPPVAIHWLTVVLWLLMLGGHARLGALR